MRWSAARTRPALAAGHRRFGTFELHGSKGYSDACQLLSRQRVFAVPHAIREDVEGEGLGVLARARRPFAEHGLVSHVLARPPAPFRFGHGCGELRYRQLGSLAAAHQSLSQVARGARPPFDPTKRRFRFQPNRSAPTPAPRGGRERHGTHPPGSLQ